MKKDTSKKITRLELLESRKGEFFCGIDWGTENLTYNEIKANLNLLNISLLDVNASTNLGRPILIKDMQSENNPYHSFIEGWMGRIIKIFFSRQLTALYLLGFQRGFEEGGKAMEAEYLLLNKEDQNQDNQ